MAALAERARSVEAEPLLTWQWAQVTSSVRQEQGKALSMITRQTVGQLRAALAEIEDEVVIDVVLEGRCMESSGIAVLGVHDGKAVLDADGDDSPYLTG